MRTLADWSSLVVDVDAGRWTFEGPAGCWSGPSPVPLPRGEVVRTRFEPDAHEFSATMRWGTTMVFDLPGGRGVDGRLVVYLDQNAWSWLAVAARRPGDLAPDVLAAARRLTRMAEERRVVLPMSSSHMLETTRWADRDKRVAVGETMLRLSRGWRIRHPLDVRARELGGLLGLRVPDGPVVGPGVWPLDGHGADAVDDADAAVAALVLTETVLDADPVPTPAGLPWAEARQAFAATLPTGKDDRRHRDDLVAGHVWQDLFPDLRAAAFRGGMSPRNFVEWIGGHWQDPFAGLPATGLFAAMMAERLVDVRLRWSANDLTDLAALSTAAGYVDHVVTERHMGAVLGTVAGKLGRPVSVDGGLVAGVAAIEGSLAGGARVVR